MKRIIRIVCLIFGMALFAATVSTAGNAGGGGHGGHGGHDSSKEAGAHGEKAPEMGGRMIHSSNVDGYQLSYELVDMREKMKDMPEMTGSHHLMVYVKGPDGVPAENAKVGYLIEGPAGEKQKAMCMGMGGGYGADVKLDEKGVYTIKTKVVNGEDNILDSFAHEIE